MSSPAALEGAGSPRETEAPRPTGAPSANGTAAEADTLRQRLSGRWRRARLVVVLGAVVLVVAVLTVLVTGRPNAGVLDPDSAAPEGSRAVAQVLADQGVQVSRHTRADDAAEHAGPGSTLVVVDPSVLGEQQLEALAATGSDLVLVEPDAAVLRAVAPGLRRAGTAEANVEPAGCADPDARAAGRTTAGGALVAATGPGAVTCFDGAFGVTDAGDHEVRVIGQAAVLQNETVDEHGNAALALRALGEHPRLVWLMASPLDAGSEQPSATALLPGWVRWVALHLVLVALCLALWRGRRLGPLVTEPLPVVVRSAETAEGRANLYRRAGAYGRAATVLRAATMRRCAQRLGLPPGSSAAAVTTAVAEATGRDERDVAGLLTAGPPSEPAQLVRLADDLDRLEAQLAGARTGHPTHEAPTVPGSERP